MGGRGGVSEEEEEEEEEREREREREGGGERGAVRWRVLP